MFFCVLPDIRINIDPINVTKGTTLLEDPDLLSHW